METRESITSRATGAQKVEKRHAVNVIFINDMAYRELAPQLLHVAIDSGLAYPMPISCTHLWYDL